jgi:ATPase subunit of ABC transporter with duplicated ATPase domains
MHKPIRLEGLELVFPHKSCFENFNSCIPYGSRIAIIGKNGSGKSTLLKMIGGLLQPSDGSITRGKDTPIGYVPQVIEDGEGISGGQRFNKALSKALRINPDLLLLDEPTNHLDSRNRKSLMRMLQEYSGTLIIVSHDRALLRTCIDTFWHIEPSCPVGHQKAIGRIHVFSGNYDDYIREIQVQRGALENKVKALDHQKKGMHEQLMKEQQRAAKSREKGAKGVDQRKWPKVVAKSKALSAEETAGRKMKELDQRKTDLRASLSELRLPEVIVPKFSLENSGHNGACLVHIVEGSVGYEAGRPILKGINLNLSARCRIAISGNNGSGKSTLMKAIFGDPHIYKTGNWNVAKPEHIGYLDQHYKNLDLKKSVFESIACLVPHWKQVEVRRHLNDFLFRKNEEVHALVETLSGGEKARLSLAQIAARPPRLLLLDEITNNLDLETTEHVAQVLKAFTGGMILISHDEDFLKSIGGIEAMDVQSLKCEAIAFHQNASGFNHWSHMASF